MPGDLIVGLAIAVIVIGFLILVGVAFWLAIERRRSRSAPSSPAAQPRQPASQAPANQPPKAAQIVSPATLAGTEQPKDANSSGEYPSAASYDQTILPEPPKRHTRPESK